MSEHTVGEQILDALQKGCDQIRDDPESLKVTTMRKLSDVSSKEIGDYLCGFIRTGDDTALNWDLLMEGARRLQAGAPPALPEGLREEVEGRLREFAEYEETTDDFNEKTHPEALDEISFGFSNGIYDAILLRKLLTHIDARSAVSARPGNVSVTPIRPGEYLQDEIEARGWTPGILSEKSGVLLDVIEGVIAGRTISAWTADRIAWATGTEPETWLNLQAAHELAILARMRRAGTARAPVTDVREGGGE